MKIQKLKSSKLFYNKWPYKIECIQPGANKIIYCGPVQTILWCDGYGHIRNNGRKVSQADKETLKKFALAVSPFLGNKNLQVRTEGNHFNIFCADQNLLKELHDQLKPWIKKISGPTTQEEYDYMLSNGHKVVLCDSLPKLKYKYKLFFKLNFPAEQRQGFLHWIDKYNDVFEISSASKQWLMGNRIWVQDPFMYAIDEKTLSMVGLYLGGYVKKVEKFVERNKVLAV